MDASSSSVTRIGGVMNATGLYKDTLLDHSRQPRNFGNLNGADAVRRSSNRLCGDDLEVGLYFDGKTVKEARFHGRGCSICIASASLMTEAVRGKHREAARSLTEAMKRWFGSTDREECSEIPDLLDALSAVRQYPARRRCVLLAWEALGEALGSFESRPSGS